MTEKIRVTIYVDKGVWDKVRVASWGEHKSASKYLEDLIRHFVKPGVMDEIAPEVLIEPSGQEQSANVKKEAETLADGQAKLDAIRKGRDIKKDKIAKVKDSVRIESVTGFSGGYSKGDQTRKGK